MSDNKFTNRIPFEDIQSATVWSLPSLTDGAKVVSAVKKKPHNREAPPLETIEEVDPSTLKPITAEQLQKITEEAEHEAREKGYQEGLHKGFSEGEAKGLIQGEQKAYKEFKQQLQEKTELFGQLSEALMNPVAVQDSALENLVLDMAVHFAKHLINKELTEDPSSLFHLVERAIACLPSGAKNIRIYLHSDDVELAHEAFAHTGRSWTFYSDPKLSRGGCRVESDQSLVDYSIERRLQDMLEEVNYQGELDPDTLAPVPDYRPSVDLSEPDADLLSDGDDDTSVMASASSEEEAEGVVDEEVDEEVDEASPEAFIPPEESDDEPI